MPWTVEDVARAALGDLAEDAANVLLAVRWTNERYTEFTKRRLKQRRRVGEVIIPAAITAGTVTATRDSSTVTGDVTAQAAWSEGLVGRYLRVKTNWHRIADFRLSPIALELESPFAEDTAVAATYVIVQRTVALHPDAGFLGAFAHPRRRVELDTLSQVEMDLTVPERQYYASGPAVVSEVGEDLATGSRLVEIYPYSTTTELVTYVYWARPRTLELNEQLPGALELRDLKEGVLIDVMRFKAAKAASESPPNVELAAFWRNEYRAQETKWAVVQQEMVKRDQGVEDIVLLLRSRGPHYRGTIRTAYDEVYARGDRP